LYSQLTAFEYNYLSGTTSGELGQNRETPFCIVRGLIENPSVLGTPDYGCLL
jgi:hypothetical protein